MEITLENLHKFAAQYGEVYIEDTTGLTRKLRNGTPDIWDLALKADRFQVDGRWLTRSDMEEQLNQMKPANVSQVSLTDLEHIDEAPGGKSEMQPRALPSRST